ncbi:unnamed protein product [Effrenium voratum]|nr:unnamed protein product [Effrenium voratum]
MKRSDTFMTSSDTLPNYFLEHLRQNPHILESIRDFQVSYRPIFLEDGGGDDYTQEQRGAYLEFAPRLTPTRTCPSFWRTTAGPRPTSLPACNG